MPTDGAPTATRWLAVHAPRRSGGRPFVASAQSASSAALSSCVICGVLFRLRSPTNPKSCNLGAPPTSAPISRAHSLRSSENRTKYAKKKTSHREISHIGAEWGAPLGDRLICISLKPYTPEGTGYSAAHCWTVSEGRGYGSKETLKTHHISCPRARSRT